MLWSCFLIIVLSGGLSQLALGQLSLQKTVLGQTYCRADADLDRGDFRLRFRYLNTGSEPILLAKSSGRIVQLSIYSHVDGRPGELETNSTISNVSEPWLLKPVDLKQHFVTLRPGQAYFKIVNAYIFVRRTDSNQISGSIGSGNHFLRVLTSAGDMDSEQEELLGKKWQGKRRLQTSGIISQPMHFVIPKRRRVVACL
jgi:hypothetical protein